MAVLSMLPLLAMHVAGSRPAINGNDVVAYHGLQPGEMDVPGSPSVKRFVDSEPLLPAHLRHLHSGPYEFWFSTEFNAARFDADPWRYIPAFGGHCTHGIATNPFGEVNASTLVDGRVAFTCVNTTQWVVRNGTLYMNSCSMHNDFIKDPDADIAAASKVWAEFFGHARATGPINDACFQDGGRWGGDPIGHLIPPNCVIGATAEKHQQQMQVLL